MKRIILSCLAVLFLFSISSAALAAKEVKVEVLFMDHGPLQSSLKQINDIFSRYGDKIEVFWYDFESKEGVQFMDKRGITQHIPLIIWMNGRFSLPVDGKEIRFVGFPTGSGPAFFQGKWTIEDLRKALDKIIGEK